MSIEDKKPVIPAALFVYEQDAVLSIAELSSSKFNDLIRNSKY